MQGLRHLFTTFANHVSEVCGRPGTFMLALTSVVVWAVTGPLFGYSDTWQLVINTSTTIITFLMVFILQNSQNRDGKAMQAKLDELILTSKAAENRFVGVERLEENELRNLSRALADRAERMEAGEDVEPIDIPEALKDRPEPPPEDAGKANARINEG